MKRETWMFACDHDGCTIEYAAHEDLRGTAELGMVEGRRRAAVAGWTFTVNGDDLCPAHSAEPAIGTTAICRTCGLPITYTVVEEYGYKPRTGWSDGNRSDPLVCFKAAHYRHVPPSGVCRRCGCVEDRACEGGCSWAGPDVCSRCAA